VLTNFRYLEEGADRARVLAPGATLTEEEVVAHCRAGLASFKVPRHVRFVTEWPMSSTKVQTFRLREQLEAELAARRMP
jgi:acyl-CoA synthetase (AMP-forming)/AMP-acid ligase II